MIACACKKIFMGKQSSLGPIDPQIHGIPAHGVIEEFQRARDEIKLDPSKIPVWQAVIAKYSPAFIGECEKAIKWSEEMVSEWLQTGMFKDVTKSDVQQKKIDEVVANLSDHALSKSHDRHLSFDRCKAFGLKVSRLEDSQELQDAVLSVHHASILTLSKTPAYKIIENHNGKAFIQIAHQTVVQ